jgi:hypothetical protein
LAGHGKQLRKRLAARSVRRQGDRIEALVRKYLLALFGHDE